MDDDNLSQSTKRDTEVSILTDRFNPKINRGNDQHNVTAYIKWIIPIMLIIWSMTHSG